MMPTLIPVHVPASKTLAELNAFVAQNEGFFGPLSDLDYNNAPSTVLLFEMTGAVPANHAVIALQSDGTPQVPAGSELVCQGLVFVQGQLQLAAATRP